MAEPPSPLPGPPRYAVTFTVIVESGSGPADAGRRGWYLLTTPQPPSYRFPVLTVTGEDRQITVVDLNDDQPGTPPAAAPGGDPGEVPGQS